MPGNFSFQTLANFVASLARGTAHPYLRSASLQPGGSTAFGPAIRQLVASRFLEQLAADSRDKLVLLRLANQKWAADIEVAFQAVAKAAASVGFYYMQLEENEVPPEYEKRLGTANIVL